MGGASAAGIAANALLQLIAVLIIGWYAVRSAPAVTGWRSFWICAVIAVLVVALQLAPLPAAMIDQIPGRAAIAGGYHLLGLAPGWEHISLDSDATIASALSLLPPFAVAAATLQATKPSRDLAVLTMLALIVVEIALGALQLTSGGRYYFYENTNATSAVGFFANANHMATLLLVGLPFVAALGGAARSSTGRRRDQPALLALALFFILCLGVLLNGSVAGLGLLLPAAGAGYLVYRRRRDQPIPSWVVVALVVVVVLLIAFAVFGPLHDRLLDKKFSEADPTTRRTSYTVTAHAAMNFFPIGSGLGTFVPVYQFHESLARVTSVFVNHAHCDYLEALLELGALAPLLLFAFVIWFVRRATVVWRGEEPGYSLARAGSIAVLIVMAHSLVDYPIRTAAIASIFGFALALMAAPEAIVRPPRSSRAAGRHFTAKEATS
jgi:O-antigen ligase